MSEPEAETRPPHALEPAPPAPDDAGDAQQPSEDTPDGQALDQTAPDESEAQGPPEDYEPIVTRLPEALQAEREAAEAAAPPVELEE